MSWYDMSCPPDSPWPAAGPSPPGSWGGPGPWGVIAWGGRTGNMAWPNTPSDGIMT